MAPLFMLPSAVPILAMTAVTLAVQGQTSVSWVPYQADCPILLLDVKTEAVAGVPRFEFADVENVSAAPVDEITVGLLAGTNEIGKTRRLAAFRTVTARMQPGERRRVTLQLDAGDVLPVTARREDFLTTLGVIQVRSRGSSLWVSAASVAGDFIAATWPSAESRGWCVDEKRRIYPPGAVLLDEMTTARICRTDGTWAPRP